MNPTPVPQPGQVTLSKPLFIGLMIVVVLLFFGVCYLLIQRTTPPAVRQTQTPSPTNHANNVQTITTQPLPTVQVVNGATVTPAPTSEPITPEDVTKTFYTWYFTYKGDPLRSGAYRQNDLLSTSFKEFIDEEMTSVKVKNDDPMFCPDNKTTPQDVLYESAISTIDTKALVKIRRISDWKYLYDVALTKSKGKWLINDIVCQFR